MAVNTKYELGTEIHCIQSNCTFLDILYMGTGFPAILLHKYALAWNIYAYNHLYEL